MSNYGIMQMNLIIMQMMSKCLPLIIFASMAIGDCHLIQINDGSSRKYYVYILHTDMLQFFTV